MKKLFVYVTVLILLFLQACNNNSASKNTATDSMLNETNNNGTADQNADTLKKKNTTRIDSAEVPAAVIAAFNNKYSNVSNVKWLTGDNKKGRTFYRVRWQENGKKITAMFRDNGSFIRDKQMN